MIDFYLESNPPKNLKKFEKHLKKNIKGLKAET